jgi:hypothetical protein
MADIRITPAASVMAFTSSLGFKETFIQGASGSIVLAGSGSTGRTNLFAVDGNNGRLFSIDDDLSNSLFSVNTIAGLPVIEAFADNTVNIGKYGAYSFQALGNGNAGIGSGSVMFVSASGVVGIGTTDPSGGGIIGSKFTINQSDNSTAIAILNGASRRFAINPIASGGFTIFDGGGGNWNPGITQLNGNVGIGTTNPGYKLEVNGSTWVSGTVYINRGVNSTEGYIYLDHPGTQVWKQGIFNDNTSTFSIGNGGGFSRLFNITNAGNVGIGTTSPSSKLHIASATTGPIDTFLIESTAGNAAFAIKGLNTGNYVYQTFYQGSVGKFELGITPTDSDFYINPNVQVGPTGAAIYIKKSNGNVGIGTTSPISKLHIYGANTIITLTNTNASGYGEFIFYEGATFKAEIFVVGSSLSGYAGANSLNIYQNSNAPIAFYTNGANERMRIAGGGNIGIGTTNPSQKLTVGDGAGTGNQYVRVNASASDIYIGQSGGTIIGLSANSAGLIISDNTSYPFAMGTIAAQPLIFGTTNTERMRISSAGAIKFNAYGAGSNTGTATYNLAVNSSGNVIEVATGGGGTPGGSSGQIQYNNSSTFAGAAGISTNGYVLTMASTSTPSTVTDSISLFAQDVNASSELKVKDEAGNVTTLSPHNFSLIPEGPSEDLAWSYYSENKGKKINVDMLKLARILEKLTGEKLVYIEE